MNLNLEELANFLVKAKTNSYAANGKEVQPERAGFKELQFSEGDYDYRDSYSGFYLAPGQEVVRFKGMPIWSMSFSGGMKTEYHGNREFAKQTFTFLKKALSLVETTKPFRGPKELKEGDWKYTNSNKGGITNFNGTEKIFYQEKEVFVQHYIGGIIIHK